MDRFEQEALNWLNNNFPDRKQSSDSQRLPSLAGLLRSCAGAPSPTQSLKDAVKAITPRNGKVEVLMSLQDINMARKAVADAVAASNFALQLSQQNGYVAKDGTYALAAQNRIVDLEKLSLLLEKAARS